MSNRAWMPLHIGDYLADTGHLTATEHGAYLLLIMHYWQNGCLPENDRVIARIAKLSPEQWEESRDMLAMLFGPNWTHKRIDAELSKADEIIEKRRAAAEARYGKVKGTSSANAMQMDSKCSDTGVPPTTNNQSSSLRSEDEARQPRKRAQRMPDDFDPDLDFAVGEGLTLSEAKAEVAKMRDWSKSSPNGAKLDWPATWRSWVRRIAEGKHRPTAQSPSSKPRSEFRQHQQAVKQEFEKFLGINHNDDKPTSNGPAFDLEPGDWRPH